MFKTFPALAALAAATALVVPTISHAQDEKSVRVSYADLDLAKPIGQARLQTRISFAAQYVCGTADPRDLNFTRAVGDCRQGRLQLGKRLQRGIRARGRMLAGRVRQTRNDQPFRSVISAQVTLSSKLALSFAISKGSSTVLAPAG